MSKDQENKLCEIAAEKERIRIRLHEGKYDIWEVTRKYLQILDEENRLKAIIAKGEMRKQNEQVAEYLNGLFRNPESRPINDCEEIYIMHHNTNIERGWYFSESDSFCGDISGRINFNRNNIFGWCYKSELFPDCSKLKH